MRRTLRIAAATMAFGLAAVAPAAAQICPVGEPDTSLDVVISPTPPADECDHLGGSNPIEFFDAYSWQIFIALNWPAASGARGVPDTTKTIADQAAPRVWETWKSVEEVYAPNGKLDGMRPKEWAEPDANNVCKNASELGAAPTKILADLNQGDNEGQGIGPIVAQNRTYVRYEIRMNRAEFDQIRSMELYLRSKLPTKDAEGTELPLLPDGAIDIKAAWREAKAGENVDRYYAADGLALDPATGLCDKRRFVLIGFHIAQKTPRRPQWIWSTFEHVDNITVAAGAPSGTMPSLNDPSAAQTLGANPGLVDAANPPNPDPDPVQVVPVPAGNPIPLQTQATNTKWHNDPAIKDTIWRFYQLVKTQWPANPAAGEIGGMFPSTRVANLTMETYRQADTCIGCHRKTTHRTDFVWFLSNRAYPIDGSNPSNAKILKDSTAK